MAKIRIKYSLFNQNTKEENKADIFGIEKEEKIIYLDEGKRVIWNKKNFVLKKETYINESIVLSFNPDNPIAYCQINETKFYFEMNINDLKQENNKIEIDYEINDEWILFKLEYESVIE